MHEVEERPGQELLFRIPEGPHDRRIDPLESAVQSGDAEQIERMVEDQPGVALRLSAAGVSDGHDGHDERGGDGPGEREPGEQSPEARRGFGPHGHAPGPAQRLEALLGRRRGVQPALEVPAVDTDLQPLRVEPQVHGQQTARYEGDQDALSIRPVPEFRRLEEVETGTAPERADVAGGDGRQRRAGADGSGQHGRVGHVGARPQVRQQPAGEGGDQFGGGSPLHPHGVDEADAPGRAVRHLSEAPLIGTRLVGQFAPEGDDRRPEPPEDTLCSHACHQRAALGGRLAVPVDGSARDEIAGNAQQHHDRQQ